MITIISEISVNSSTIECRSCNNSQNHPDHHHHHHRRHHHHRHQHRDHDFISLSSRHIRIIINTTMSKTACQHKHERITVTECFVLLFYLQYLRGCHQHLRSGFTTGWLTPEAT